MPEPTPGSRSEDLLRSALRAAIPAAGRHQVTIADDLGITTKHLCAMLTGRARLTLDWAERIAEACGHEVVVAVERRSEPDGITVYPASEPLYGRCDTCGEIRWQTEYHRAGQRPERSDHCACCTHPHDLGRGHHENWQPGVAHTCVLCADTSRGEAQ
ncbi:hypothetical protein BJF79_03830 [Actinomadura sp. CNU-125]|uniref:helix-turn-helix domain-containing protein n=1 Tax=Actinomadura sp. CNU-125 TaxID=1904961 RepID=UPI000966218F|nr:helix-turn-helix domain-containing protein [Actinomadura sp. CNU-125]OLT13039.1 hypothetical protein BJF79_03830 [Actinomadura sp. CNU-125]